MSTQSTRQSKRTEDAEKNLEEIKRMISRFDQPKKRKRRIRLGPWTRYRFGDKMPSNN